MAGEWHGDLLAERDHQNFWSTGSGEASRAGATTGGDGPPGPPSGAPGGRRKGGWRKGGWRNHRLMLFIGIPLSLLLVVAAGGAIAVWKLQSNLDHKISRFGDPFAQLPATTRPPKAAGPASAMNLLVFGSDSRISAGNPAQWAAGAQRTDAIMLVHVPADRSGAYVISILRDSWVQIPGHGFAKINAAFSWGGPALAIQTVEQLTGIHIDHMMVTDFTGFARITDLLGGVQITVPKDTNMGNSKARMTAGTYTMDGTTALGYVRERYTLPNGDFDRVKRQQNWIRAIMHKAASAGVATNPQRLYDLLGTTASSLATDDSFSIGQLRDLALSLRGAGPGGLRFLTVPTTGTGWSPDHKQSIVLLDTTKAAGLWSAVAHDTVNTWLADAAYPTLRSTVN
jgi:LCP family protein required for cell wall assembly